MATRGPVPRPAHTQQNAHRRRQRESEMRVIECERGVQPALPEGGFDEFVGGKMQHFEWHPLTVELWDAIGRSAMSKDYLDIDWAFLLRFARIDSRIMWGYSTAALLEIWLKFNNQYGFTEASRARLRMQVAFAEESEKRAAASDVAPSGSSVRQRRGVLKAV